jgi:ribose 1,5-bisphosphokinase
VSAGRFIAVVGPSGVGKDSVMAGLMARRPGLRSVRRVITRAADAGGEAFDSVTVAAFEAREARGDFVLHWGAHGLSYGIPAEVSDDLAAGRDVLVNLSRGVLTEAAVRFPGMVVLSLTADRETLASRLVGRGREPVADLAARLARAAPPVPEGVPVVEVCNDGTLAAAVDAAEAGLFGAAGQCVLSPSDQMSGRRETR